MAHTVHTSNTLLVRLFVARYMNHVKAARSCLRYVSLYMLVSIRGRVDCRRFLYTKLKLYIIFHGLSCDGLLQCSTFWHSRTFRIALFSECNIFDKNVYVEYNSARTYSCHIFLANSVFISSLWAAYALKEACFRCRKGKHTITLSV